MTGYLISILHDKLIRGNGFISTACIRHIEIARHNGRALTHYFLYLFDNK